MRSETGEDDAASIAMVETPVDSPSPSRNRKTKPPKQYVDVSESRCAFVLRFVVQLVLVCCATAGFFALFAGPGIGFGVEIYSEILKIEHYALLCVAGAAVLTILLYVFDFSFWTGWWKLLRAIILGIIAAAVAVGAMLASKQYPGAPIALYVLGFPAFIWFVKAVFYPNVHVSLFAKSMGLALFLDAAACVVVWLVWVFATGWLWNDETKFAFNEFMHCDSVINGTTTGTLVTTTTLMMMTTSTASTVNTTAPFFAAPIEFDGEVTVCLTAWLLWAAPLFAACNAFVFGVMSLILSSALRRTDKAVNKALKIFFVMISIAIVGLWVAASIAGAGIGVNGAVQLFVGVFVMVLSGVVIGTVGWSRLTAQLMSVPMVRQLSASLFTDWFKALFFIAFAPVLPVYLLLSTINQFLRKRLPFGYTIDSDRERSLRLTSAASAQLRAIKRWRWSSVLTKVMWIGIIYATLQVVVALVVNLFMSWLNDALEPFPLWATTLIFFAIGVVMLLLPPVPGVPIYITAGIILGKQGEALMTFPGALAFAVGVSFAIKAVGGLIQQKGFGEGLSRSLYVRRTVGVNSVSIRAVRRLLSVPGLSVGKVMILIGSPDWPIFVLTGILKQSVWQMQLATAPILVLIAPLVLAGGFLLKADQGGSWEAIGNVTLAVAALLQVLAMLLALHYVAREVDEHYDELAAEPNDPQVEEADRADEQRTMLTMARQSWFAVDFPTWMRALLISGTVATLASINVLVLLEEYAFAAFAVTDDIDETVKGDINNLVFPWGWVFLGLLTWSIIVLIVFARWTAYRVKHVPLDFVVPDAIRDEMAVNPPTDNSASITNATAATKVASATVSILKPDATADAEAQAHKDRKRARDKILMANAAYKDSQ